MNTARNFFGFGQDDQKDTDPQQPSKNTVQQVDNPNDPTWTPDMEVDSVSRTQPVSQSSSGKDTGGKMLCAFADGTWNNLEMETPTNIFHLASALKKRNNAGKPVVAFYDSGIGSQGDFAGESIKEGAVGMGIDLNIKQLYTFLCMNYEKGDKICLFGFSRGAYTVRSLGGMISEVGLLPRSEINYVDEAYETYRNKKKETEKSRNIRKAHPFKVNIKLIMCFDTVGALGLPLKSLPIIGGFFGDRYTFHNTELSKIVEHGIHACSIDEDRESFDVSPMKPNKDIPNQVTEKYFVGHHSGVGGGWDEEKGCSTIACHWVIDEIARRNIDLIFDKKELDDYEQAKKSANVANIAFFSQHNAIRMFSGFDVRDIPSYDYLHEFVKEKYKKDVNWRPKALAKFEKMLLA